MGGIKSGLMDCTQQQKITVGFRETTVNYQASQKVYWCTKYPKITIEELKQRLQQNKTFNNE